MSSPKPNETSAHPKTPAHDSHATHQPYVSAQPYGYLFPPPGLPHPQQQVGHPIMPGGPGSGALLNRFGSTTPALVHGQPMDPKSVPTRPCPRLLPRMNHADFILPDEFGSPFNTHTPSYRAPPVPPPLSPEIASVGGGGNDSTKAKTKKVDKKVVVKPKSTVKDDNDDDSNDNDEPGPKRGRTKGSSQYTDKERTEIIRLIGKFLPIGGTSWDALADSYNSWAKKNGLPGHERPALQVQWAKIHKVAKIKATGTATRPQILVDACAAGSAIEKKVALGDLQDEDVGDINIDDEEDNNEVLTITSDSDKDTNQKAAKKKGKKPAVGTVLTKAYKTEAPLWPTSRKTQSTNFLEKISLTLDPAAMQQCNENRSSANFQLLMLQSYQSQITTLTTQVNEERRRADDAESELRMLPTPHVQAVLLYTMNGGAGSTTEKLNILQLALHMLHIINIHGAMHIQLHPVLDGINIRILSIHAHLAINRQKFQWCLFMMKLNYLPSIVEYITPDLRAPSLTLTDQ
ncbi:hypothetical protein F5890DRAFT_1641773 [Lentinula detonsa]|uniref:Uncharacterized protein n=1 Tax=Lentinula detonsa TaxID=2804962 RepID=A0AA38PPF9_9AGAR|nr:hypothetical protein F5890DRAFT_1641773 [Lentinula detonsa]